MGSFSFTLMNKNTRKEFNLIPGDAVFVKIKNKIFRGYLEDYGDVSIGGVYGGESEDSHYTIDLHTIDGMLIENPFLSAMEAIESYIRLPKDENQRLRCVSIDRPSLNWHVTKDDTLLPYQEGNHMFANVRLGVTLRDFTNAFINRSDPKQGWVRWTSRKRRNEDVYVMSCLN